MGPEFRPLPGAEGWQQSNPPILSLAAVRAALEVFQEAGGMAPLRAKSERLTGFLETLLRRELPEHIEVLTPSDPARRGWGPRVIESPAHPRTGLVRTRKAVSSDRFVVVFAPVPVRPVPWWARRSED